MLTFARLLQALTRATITYTSPPTTEPKDRLLPPASLLNQNFCTMLVGSLHQYPFLLFSRMSSECVPIWAPSRRLLPAGSWAVTLAATVTVMTLPAGAHRPVLIHLVSLRGGMGPTKLLEYVVLTCMQRVTDSAGMSGADGQKQ